jgi:predicted permease
MQLLADIRYTLRQSKNAPGFTATAILTLALGIGATTAIFSLVHAVLMKSLPVAKPEELWRIGSEEHCCVDSGLQGNWSLFSFELYRRFKENTSGVAGLAAFQAGKSLVGVRRAGSNRPSETLSSEYVSGNYFTTFGVPAYAGRTLNPQDDDRGAPLVAVMSFRTWQERFGKDPAIVGASFVVNAQPLTVVGVAPREFFGDRIRSNPPALWVPLAAEPSIEPTDSFLKEPAWDWLDIMGRLKPASDPRAVEAQMQVELRQFLQTPQSKIEESEKPLIATQGLHLSPGGGGVQTMRNEYQDGLHLLMLVSAFVLLIACANLASLMLVRAATRKQQTSVRSALGASRSQLIRQALTESLVLSAVGGMAGIAIAFMGTRLILAMAFGNEYVPIRATPSLPVLAFASVASLVTGVLFGIAPAWAATRANPAEALRGANRSTDHHAGWTQKFFVVTQAALSFTLLCAAGLLIRSLNNMRHRDFGFETRNRFVAHINPLMAGYKPDQLEALYRQIHDNLGAIPGVQQTSVSLYSPMDGDTWNESVFIEGQPPPPPATKDHDAVWLRVSPGYFDSIGTKVIEGRGFQQEDRSTTRAVAVVNRAFVRKYFTDGRAIGKHFSDERDHPGAFEIVGVTEDSNYSGPVSTVSPMYFLAQGQIAHIDDAPYRKFEDTTEYLDSIEIMTRGDVPGLDVRVRRAISQINLDLAVIDFQSFDAQVNSGFAQEAMIAKLTSLFGMLSLVLASVGLYGVMAHFVKRRTSEIGIRMAVGADRGQIVRLVLGNALAQIVIGIAIGIPTTFLGGRLMASKLFGVTPLDPTVLITTAVVLATAAIIAALVPALWAARTEPMLALRAEQ